MNERPILTDASLEAMLARRAGPGAPAGLTDSIAAGLDSLPRGRGHRWLPFGPPAGWSPALRVASIVVLIGLLLAATMSALYVGSDLLRHTRQLTVVPPTVTPEPSVAPGRPEVEDPRMGQPFGEVVFADTAIGTIAWQRYRGYPVAEVVASSGPVGIDGHDLVWLGADGTVQRTRLPAEEARSLASIGDELIVYWSAQGYGHAEAWPVWWDGSGYVVGDALDVPPDLFGGGSTDVQVVPGPGGVLIVGYGVAVAHDARNFVTVPEPPGEGDQIGPAFATADGFIALVSPGRPNILTSDPPFQPVPWFSVDGLTWAPVAPSSPFGERSWIRGVTGHDGRFVAVGNVGNVYGNTGGVNGPWAVWVSDDGRTWERLPDLEPGWDRRCPRTRGDCPIAVTSGDAGWVISTGRHQSLWASADGRTWEPLAVPGISVEEPWGLLPGLVLGGETIVVMDSDGVTSAVGTIRSDGGGAG